MSDGPRLAKSLAMLALQSWQTRVRRSISRLLLPKRLLATCAAALFLLLYASNGLLVILTRRPADPAALTLWLSGSMAIYAIFHFVRASWQAPDSRLGMTAAENLWIAGAPVRDCVLVFYRIAGILPSTIIKTLLIATVLFCDVESPFRLFISLLIAMITLEAIRMIADRFASALSLKGRVFVRTAVTAIAVLILIQLAARTIASASGSVHPLAILNAISKAAGDTAGSAAIQCLSTPWWPMTQLAVAPNWNALTVVFLLLSALTLVVAIIAVVLVDAWASWHQNWVEGARLSAFHRGLLNDLSQNRQKPRPRNLLFALPRLQGIGPLISRQWVGVVRYRATIFVSFAVPTALSLAPLMTSSDAGLLHVSAWLAVCTMLLAPPALRIDFRRDIDRMWLLKSLPITPLVMTIGQIALPSLITILFQITTITIACLIIPSTPATILLVVGGLSGFALFSFAVENSLFLTFPHRPKQEGLAMMVRAKLVFLGKGILLMLLGAGFVAWITLCEKTECPIFLLIAGCIIASWTSAATAVAITARCWRRFDMQVESH
jgi:hypothetical protein